jgi:hypothetical protein
MASLALDDVRAQFDAFAVQYDALLQQPLERLNGEALASLSAMVRAADAVLATTASLPAWEDPERVALLAWVRILRSAVIRLLAVAGPDASWGDREQEALSLTSEESELVASLLLDPPKPNQRLRAAARRYREMVGL